MGKTRWIAATSPSKSITHSTKEDVVKLIEGVCITWEKTQLTATTLPSKLSIHDTKEDVVKLRPRVGDTLGKAQVKAATLPSKCVEQSTSSINIESQSMKLQHEVPKTRLPDEVILKWKSDCDVHLNRLSITSNSTVKVTASMLLNLPLSKYRPTDYYSELQYPGTDSADRLSKYSGKTEVYWLMD